MSVNVDATKWQFSRQMDKQTLVWGTWVAQSVEHLTWGFGSCHDLTVCDLEPRLGFCTDRVDPAWDSLSPPSLSAPAPSLKINK